MRAVCSVQRVARTASRLSCFIDSPNGYLLPFILNYGFSTGFPVTGRNQEKSDRISKLNYKIIFMKHLLIAFSLLACLFSTSAFAGNNDVTPVIEQSFHQTFSDATQVSWTHVNDFYRVGFLVNGTEHFAYYNNSGELIVVAKEIEMSKLPKALREDFQKRYNNNSTAQVFQFDNDEGRQYYLLMSEDTKQVTLKAVGKKWEMFLEK
jgi:hypothetical protein